MDQKLLLAVISTVRLDAEVLVEKWRELFLGMCPPPISFPIVSVSLFSSLIHLIDSSHWGKNKYRLTGTATDQEKSPTKRAIVEHVAKLKRSMGIGGVKGKVKVKVKGDEVQEEEEEDDGLGKFGKSGKKEKKLKMKMKGTVTSSGDPTRLRGKGRQGKGQMSSRFPRDMTDDELDDEHVLGESRIKNEDAEYASLPFTAMMADDDTPCPTPRNAKPWRSIPWMFDEDDEEAETERDDSCETVRIPRSVEENATKISRPLTTLPLPSSSSSTKEDDTPRSTKRSKTSHQEKSSPTIFTSTTTFPKNTSSSSSSTPTTYSTMLSPPNPSSSATTTFQEKEELDKQQNPNANSHSNDLFVSPFWETAQAESTSTSTGGASSSLKMKKKKKMKEKEKKRSYHIVDIDAAHCSRGNKKKLKRSNDDDDDDEVGGGSSSSSKVGGRGTRKKRIPLAVLEDYPVGQ